MKAYIYNVETNEIALVIDGDNHSMIEREISNQNYDYDVYSVAFSSLLLNETVNTEYVLLDK